MMNVSHNVNINIVNIIYTNQTAQMENGHSIAMILKMFHSSPFIPPAVASDRISIQSMGHMTPQLSPQNLISCDTRNQGGCAGGRIDGAWWFLRRRG